MTEQKDFYDRLVALAFEAKVPGATAHDRLRYLNELLKKHQFKIADGVERVERAPAIRELKRYLQ